MERVGLRAHLGRLWRRHGLPGPPPRLIYLRAANVFDIVRKYQKRRGRAHYVDADASVIDSQRRP